MPRKTAVACSVCLRRNYTKHRKRDTRTKDATQRGYDHHWRKARNAHLAEHPLCIYCLAENRYTAATEVHHSKPVAEYPELRLVAEDNYESVCHTHHMRLEAQARANRN